MSEQESIHHTLESPFEYAFKGETRKAGFISLHAPTMKQHSYAASLKQSIMRSVQSNEGVEKLASNESKLVEEEGDKKDGEITSQVVLSLIFNSKGVDVNVIFEQTKELFKHGGALIDGEEKLTTLLINKMSVDDFQNLTGEYIANFTLA